MKQLSILVALASVVCATATRAGAETIYAVTTSNGLLSFDSASPGTISPIMPISGLRFGEEIVGIDFRPATGQLYGLSVVPIGPLMAGQLYTIDPRTAAASAVGGFIPPSPMAGTAFGIDFDPVADLLRVVSNAETNFRLNPRDGSVVSVDRPLTYAPGDASFGANPNVVAAAYAFGATAGLFGIDSALDILVLQNPADEGLLHTIGPLGFNTSELAGFDISGASALAYAALMPQIGIFFSGLYDIDTTTGTARFVGNIGGGCSVIQGIAVAPAEVISEPSALALAVVGVLGMCICGGRQWMRRYRIAGR